MRDLEGQPNPLAFVSARKEELAVEFMDWRADGNAHRPMEACLLDWEERQFDRVLGPAEHGILIRELKAIIKENRPVLRSPRCLTERGEGESPLAYIRRLAIDLGYMDEEGAPVSDDDVVGSMAAKPAGAGSNADVFGSDDDSDWLNEETGQEGGNR